MRKRQDADQKQRRQRPAAGKDTMTSVAPTPGYRDRLAEASIASSLEAVGAVVVEGPRACGKTWTARQFAASEVLFDGSDEQRLAFAVDLPEPLTPRSSSRPPRKSSTSLPYW